MYPNRRAVSRLVLADFGFILDGTLTIKKKSFAVRMRDIALGGASFIYSNPDAGPDLSSNDFLTISLSLRGTPIRFDAEVVWATTEACGVRFVEDLTRSNLHDLIRLLVTSAS